MQCPRCHAENREGRRFCGECGLSFASACPSCGFLNEGSEKFCGGCGRSLTPSSMPAESRLGSPQSYTPKHLAEKKARPFGFLCSSFLLRLALLSPRLSPAR